MNSKKIKFIGTGVVCALATVSTLSAIKKIKDLFKREFNNLNFSTGIIRQFGTLYLDDEKVKRPLDFVDYSDIREYNGEKIEIRNTDKDNVYKLSWIEINYEDKKMLISDRNILKNISFDELDLLGFVKGKVITIDGYNFMLRLLKESDIEREWEKYILNENDILGLPDKVNQDEFEKDVEDLWHNEIPSFIYSKKLDNTKYCLEKGKDTRKEYRDFKENTGYRPVLQLLED
ncbi:hypothetical protein [Clostridium sp. BJN0001]|uniref:hypothetical protein n=1 Tax=Clostridium sp. BJN0001 TaxID=2930219 RepID=UPI001FD15479|nr:hypothetical protein [Clostridium sp. BJN0001]